MALFNMLMDVLNELYQAQLEMIELANRKKQVLIEGNAKELSKIIKLESTWVKRVGKLEEERILIIEKLLQERHISLANMTMSELIKALTSPSEKEQLEEILINFNKAISRIQRLNELNTKLIKQSLDYIARMFAIITEDTHQAYTYANPKQHNNIKQRRSFFDQKA